MRTSALALATLAACGPPHGAHQLATEGVLGSPAPATFSANVLYATASVDGVAGGRLLVDSGAPRLVLSPGAWSGARVAAGAGVIDALTVGGLTIEKVPDLGVDLFGERPGFRPAGILGAEVMCQFATVLDYRDAEVRLAGGPPTDVTDITLPGTQVELRLEGGGGGTLDGAQFQYPATRIPVSALIDGVPRVLVLDSGASYLVLRDALWSALAADGRPTLSGVPILSAAGRIAGQLTRARTVSVGGEEVTAPPVLDIGDALLDSFAAEVGHPVDGLLGGAFLREFLTTLDYPRGQLWLQRYTTRDHIDPDEFHQVGLAIDVAPASGHRFQVSHVYANTSAAAAGLAAGDLLVSIDGNALDTLGTDDAERLLHGPVGAQRQLVTSAGSFTVAVDDLLPVL